MTFNDYLNTNLSPSTADSYNRAINHFLTYSDYKELSTYSDILEYLHRYEFRSPGKLAALKQYFDYLIHIKERFDHPCRELVIKQPNKPIQFQLLFTPEELERLLNRNERYMVLAERNKVIISLLIYQALTPQNLINLKLSDINIEMGTVHVKATSSVSQRVLELKPSQIMFFYRYINESREELISTTSEYLLIGNRGKSIDVDTIRTILRPLKKLFPLKKLHAGTIRQSVIYNWLNCCKIPLEDVQLLSGQKWISTTEKYIKPNTKEKRRLINQFFPI